MTCFKKLRSVFSVHPEPFHIIVGKASGIKSWDDLKGKRVNIGNPGSGQRATVEILMERYGWTADEAMGKSYLELVPSPGMAGYRDQILATLVDFTRETDDAPRWATPPEHLHHTG